MVLVQISALLLGQKTLSQFGAEELEELDLVVGSVLENRLLETLCLGTGQGVTAGNDGDQVDTSSKALQDPDIGIRQARAVGGLVDKVDAGVNLVVGCLGVSANFALLKEVKLKRGVS